MLTQARIAVASPILTVNADISGIFCELTITFIAVVFVHTFTIILTSDGHAFVDVNITAVTRHDVIITAARHAAADVDVGSHELTQLIDEFSGPYVTPVPAL